MKPKHLARLFAAAPGYAITVCLTVAVTVGAMAVIIAVVDAVVLQPLPYPRHDRLVSVTATVPGPGGRESYLLSAVEFIRLRQQTAALEQVEALLPGESTMVAGENAETVRSGRVSAGFLRLLGLSTVSGRDFSETEDQQRAQVVVLDGSFWRRRFAADREIIGRAILLDGSTYTVIGVTPEGYRPLLYTVDVWMPLSAVEDPARIFNRGLVAAGRLGNGVTIAQAKAEADLIQESIAKQYPQTHSTAEISLVDLHESLHGSYRNGLLLLLGGVSLLMVIACANLANLALNRVLSRQGEFALLLSLGASRSHVIRAQLAEMATLVAIGSLIGLGIVAWTVPVFLAVYPEALPAGTLVQVNLRTGSAAVLILVVVTFLSGLAPAVRAGRIDVRQAIAASSARHTGGRDTLLRRGLLAAQILFAVALLGVAASAGASMLRLARSDPGFKAHNVLTLQLAPPARYPELHQRAAFVERVIDTVAALPGVIAAGSTQTTFNPNQSMQTRIDIENMTVEPGALLITHVRHITPGYFAALGVDVVQGRAIDRRDRLGAPPVAMVSRAFADHYWPGSDPVGKRFRRLTSANLPWLTVVGVAADVMDSGLGVRVGPAIYLPYLQQNTPTARVSLVVRTSADPELQAAVIQKAIWSVDPAQPIDMVRSLDRAISESVAQPRFRTLLLSMFGLIGLLLAGIGVYGIAAESATQRRQEIGVRLALGSTPGQIVSLLLRQAAPPLVLGGGLGVIVGVAAQTLIRSTLHDPQQADLWIAPATGALLLSAVALLATWLPAVRASRTAPVMAIRDLR